MRAQALEATLDELVEHGYAALRFEAVAARAGVHKTTLYRWWPSTAALVVDALAPAAASDPDSVNTGSLEGDLIALYRADTDPADVRRARAITAIFEASAGRDPELDDLRVEVWNLRVASVAAILERAQARGEIRPKVDPRAVCDLLYGSMYVRSVIRREKLPRRPPADVLAIVLDGVRS